MRILALDASLARCGAALVHDDAVLALRQQDGREGQAALLPILAAQVLGAQVMDAQVAAPILDAPVLAAGHGPALDGVGVTVGPGSFTGIRAALALAHGIGLAAGVPVVGVTVAEALADSLPNLGRRVLWTAIDSRRGRVFLDRGNAISAVPLDGLPTPAYPVALAGDAAPVVAARLAARGVDVMLTDARLPQGRHIAAVAARRLAGDLAALPAQPLYVDPPEARPPAGGLRPPPQP